MSELRNKPVLVTGAGGFIGSHLVERLLKEGAEVTALVHYNALGARGWLDHVEKPNNLRIVPGDVCDRDLVTHLSRGMDVIFHLAALISIPYSYRAPSSFLRVNTEGSINVFQAALTNSVRRVVHTSTSEVYGTARYVPIDEEHPLQAQSPYAASKIAADKMADSFHCSFNLPVVTVRPFNTFGPRQSVRAVIPTLIVQAMRSGQVKIGKLTPTRDLNYVSNTVDGYIKAACAPHVEGKTINLGSGVEISIADLAALIGELMGAELHLVQTDERIRPEKSEVERLLAANKMARETLEWAPAVDLRAGLERTISWFKTNLSCYHQDGTIY